MDFTIENADYQFHLVVNQYNQLIGFTATKDQKTYDCAIQLKSQTDPLDTGCCRPYPPGCSGGPC
jgi:hypothetical protein